MSRVSETAPLTRALDELDLLTREWQELFPHGAPQAGHWLKVLGQIKSHLEEDCLRLAAVGTVKSGKSTLINALTGQDLLRRGAGILTAMITRLQPGPRPRAVLRFKTWEEITQELNRALAFFPGEALASLKGRFDLRRVEHRDRLRADLEAGDKSHWWTGSTLNQEWLLLKSYVEGFEEAAPFLDSGSLVLEGPELARHGDLVTREATAIYLKDVLLTVPLPDLPGNLELGDCQGSDSPIPQHLAQVLTYLLRCDLVLYVISSRVGLRQGDFQFLNEIKRMGLLPHTWFLLNVDLGELRGLPELQAFCQRLARELAPVAPEAPRFAFSALEVLLRRRQERGETLESRDAALLPLWEAQPEALAFCREEFHRFWEAFRAALERLRQQRQAGGGLSQARMVARGLREQLELALTLSGREAAALEALKESALRRREPLLAARRALSQALAGATERLKAEVKKRVGSFLDPYSGQGAAVFDFLAAYQPDWDALLPADFSDGFRPALYRLYQDLQTNLEQFVAREMTARILEFLRLQEEWLKQELLATAAPLFLSVQEALSLYYQELAAAGLPGEAPRLKVELPPFVPELEVPLLTLNFQSEWRLAGEAWLRSGAGRLRRAWEWLKARLGREAVTDPRLQTLKDLAWALQALKRRLREELRISLVDFGERLKYRYFFPWLEGLAAGLEAQLDDLLGSLLAHLEGTVAVMEETGAARESRRQRLRLLLEKAAAVEGELARL